MKHASCALTLTLAVTAAAWAAPGGQASTAPTAPAMAPGATPPAAPPAGEEAPAPALTESVPPPEWSAEDPINFCRKGCSCSYSCSATALCLLPGGTTSPVKLFVVHCCTGLVCDVNTTPVGCC